MKFLHISLLFLICLFPRLSWADAQLAELHARPIVTMDNPMTYRMAKPPGDGPFPVVVYANNCGGYDMPDIAKGYHRHTARFVKLGYAVVWDEHYKTHGIKNCSNIDYPKWANNVLKTAAWVKEQSWSNKDKVFLVGFSAGGVTASNVLANAGEEKSVFAKVVLMYASCGARGFTDWKTTTPVRYYVGSKDTGSGHPQACHIATLQVNKTNYSQRIFEGAYHAFDLYEEGSKAIDGDSNGSPSAIASIAWWKDVQEFLK